jgi:hypothetical protein
MVVLEYDLVVVQILAKFNDNDKYILSVIDVISKFLHIVSLRYKKGTAVSSAFRSMLNDPKYSKPLRRRPVWMRTDRGKEVLNRSVQDMLKNEGIQFQVCRDPNVKCAIVERSRRTIRINCTNTSPIKTRTHTLTFAPNSSILTTTLFTVQMAWRH